MSPPFFNPPDCVPASAFPLSDGGNGVAFTDGPPDRAFFGFTLLRVSDVGGFFGFELSPNSSSRISSSSIGIAGLLLGPLLTRLAGLSPDALRGVFPDDEERFPVGRTFTFRFFGPSAAARAAFAFEHAGQFPR